MGKPKRKPRGRPKLSALQKAERRYDAWLTQYNKKWVVGGPKKLCPGRSDAQKQHCQDYRKFLGNIRTRRGDEYRGERGRLRNPAKYQRAEARSETRRSKSKNKTEEKRRAAFYKKQKQSTPARTGAGNNGSGKSPVILLRALASVAEGKQPTEAQQRAAVTQAKKSAAKSPAIIQRALMNVAEGNEPTEAQQRAAADYLGDMELGDNPF